MNYYFLFHYFPNTRQMYMIEGDSRKDAESEFIKKMNIKNPRNIIITNITVINEFRGSHQ